MVARCGFPHCRDVKKVYYQEIGGVCHVCVMKMKREESNRRWGFDVAEERKGPGYGGY